MILPGSGLSARKILPLQPVQAVALAQPALHVTQAEAGAEVKVVLSGGAESRAACVFLAAQKNGLLQEAASVNLNSPANCFSLSVSHSASPQWHLAVKALPATQTKIVVASFPEQIASASFGRAPFEPLIPVFPAAAFVAAAMFAEAEKKIISKTIKAAVSAKQALSLQQLQVLRC